jgi:hypothetical protein
MQTKLFKVGQTALLALPEKCSGTVRAGQSLPRDAPSVPIRAADA